MPVYSSITELIGNTPMVDVSALSPNPKVRIVAKLEGQNPGGSVKDRAALSNGAMRRAKEMAKEHPDWYFPYQYGNPANPKAHYESTGPEIWRDCPEITHFIAGLGTAGTLMGLGRYLKERNPAIQMWAVEPPAGEKVEGLRNLDDGFVPPIYDPDMLDRKIIVRPRESIEWTRRLVTEAAIFAGISAGAAMAGAAKAAAQLDEGVIVTILADGGWKYLSTGAWTDDIDEVVERASRIVYF